MLRQPTVVHSPGDLLMLLYAEVKRRGGIVKLHADYANQPKKQWTIPPRSLQILKRSA